MRGACGGSGSKSSESTTAAPGTTATTTATGSTATASTAAGPTTTAVPAPPTSAIIDAAVVSPVVSKPSAPSITTTVVARPPGAPATTTVPATWTIARGEHLWFVAESVVTQALGADIHHGEIARYWRSLVDANRERLVDRDNADLVYAGQEFVLPAVPLR